MVSCAIHINGPLKGSLIIVIIQPGVQEGFNTLVKFGSQSFHEELVEFPC
jgi:hypothetical protein